MKKYLAHVKFFYRATIYHKNMLLEKFSLAAKHYRLRKITEQVTAVNNLQQYMARAINYMQTAAKRRIPEDRERLEAYARMVIVNMRKDYRKIHPDFKHEIRPALTDFYADIDEILPKSNLPRLLS